jgi:hypothetical protein
MHIWTVCCVSGHYPSSGLRLKHRLFKMRLMFVLTLAGGVCCVWFVYSIFCWCWCWYPEIVNISIDWAQFVYFTWRWRENPTPETLHFKQKRRRWIMSRNTTLIIIMPSSEAFRCY